MVESEECAMSECGVACVMASGYWLLNCNSLTELLTIDVWTHTLCVRMREQQRVEFGDNCVLCRGFGRWLMTASNGMEIVVVS
jgi:hypothetical protein